ncbi:DUF2332 domain-containing protein [Paenibacillus sp. GXUN7292]|uniref:DUF2332 domain-containing protein n=1 Tax=Paenibacillus sp. GXUN7292 TaxID=3422499 RepID=UPI003D7C5487
MEAAAISNRFITFAERECKGSSSLYEHLSRKIANDDELLQLASNFRDGQPVPNLFFGAVHYLLLKENKHELKEYYRSIVNKPKAAGTAFPYFKDFCQTNKHEIIQLLKNKLVQTNEVRRCSYLYPAFCYIYEKTNMPLALIEIGTSAGLQLLWDKYGYFYNSGNQIYGNNLAQLIIESKFDETGLPFLLKESPPVNTRIGLDLHVNDLNNADDYLWLKSLIWPEHTERFATFEKACHRLKQQSLKLIEGNGVKLLTEMASTIPRDSVLCVFHTHVANQMPEDDKYELIEHIKKLGDERAIFHLYNNMWDSGQLHLDYYLNGKEYKETLAETDGHGEWFKWKL